MRSKYNILLALYEALNVPSVTEHIPANRIIVGRASKLLQDEFVTLNTITNPNGYIQNGVANVNIHVPKLSEERDNTFRLKQLSEIIIPILDDTTVATQHGTFHFQIEDDKGPFPDPDRDEMSYDNLRIAFQTL